MQKRKCDEHRALQGAEWQLWKERCQVTEGRELEKCALILKKTDDRRAFLQKYIKGEGRQIQPLQYFSPLESLLAQ